MFILLEAKNTEVKVLHRDRIIAVVRIYIGKGQGEIFISILEKIPIVVRLYVMVAKYSSIIEIIDYKMNYATYLPP